jgi:hypothetical protein
MYTLPDMLILGLFHGCPYSPSTVFMWSLCMWQVTTTWEYTPLSLRTLCLVTVCVRVFVSFTSFNHVPEGYLIYDEIIQFYELLCMLQWTFSCTIEYCGKHFSLDLDLCIRVHIQSLEKHFVCPFEDYERFVSSSNLKSYITTHASSRNNHWKERWKIILQQE